MSKILAGAVLVIVIGFIGLAVTINSELNKDGSASSSSNSFSATDKTHSNKGFATDTDAKIGDPTAGLESIPQAKLDGKSQADSKPFFRKTKPSFDNQLTSAEQVDSQLTSVSENSEELAKKMIESGENPDHLIKKRSSSQRDL